jgi:hypothetical protein
MLFGLLIPRNSSKAECPHQVQTIETCNRDGVVVGRDDLSSRVATMKQFVQTERENMRICQLITSDFGGMFSWIRCKTTEFEGALCRSGTFD